MNVNADTTEMNEAERREAVAGAAGLDDPAERDESDDDIVVVE